MLISLVNPGVDETRAMSLLAREHVQQRGLADVRAADEGELRQ